MRFSVLGSGSGGNSTLVAAGSTRILVDAGFSGRELGKRLAVLGASPGDLAAILVTHEHGDHVRGAGVFARAHGTRLLMTAATRRACAKLLRGTEDVATYRPGHPFTVGDVLIEPFVTVHDAVEPVALALVEQTSGLRLGVATDLGRPTAQVKHALRGCDGLIVEANHDEVLLWSAGYPAAVKARIASSHGHMSNQAAAAFVGEVFGSRLSAVVLAHLSEESNTPALARTAVDAVLRSKGYRGLVEVAPAHEPTAWLDLAALRRAAAPVQFSLF